MKTKLTILIAAITFQCMVAETVDTSKLYGAGASLTGEKIKCRTMPFFLWPHNQKQIDINTSADTIHFLGMVNYGWDSGVGHWGHHFETMTNRTDRVYIGAKLGELKINYEDKTSDIIPLIFGATIWSFDMWAREAHPLFSIPVTEPFASRPDYAAVYEKCIKLKENKGAPHELDARRHFFLSVKPQDKKISSITVISNPNFLGEPSLTGITLDNPVSTNNLVAFGKSSVDKNDLKYTIKSDAIGDWQPALSNLAAKLYTRESDLPENV
jgi:hypothetical protein